MLNKIHDGGNSSSPLGGLELENGSKIIVGGDIGMKSGTTNDTV